MRHRRFLSHEMSSSANITNPLISNVFESPSYTIVFILFVISLVIGAFFTVYYGIPLFEKSSSASSTARSNRWIIFFVNLQALVTQIIGMLCIYAMSNVWLSWFQNVTFGLMSLFLVLTGYRLCMIFSTIVPIKFIKKSNLYIYDISTIVVHILLMGLKYLQYIVYDTSSPSFSPKLYTVR